MICADLQPFSVVEDDGFRRLMKHLAPRYEIPSGKNFSRVVIPEIFNKILNSIRFLLADATALALTVDIWTSDSTDSYIGIVAHTLNSNFHRRLISLCVEPFSGSHTANLILEKFEGILSQWNISKNKIQAIIRDNAANIKKGLAEYPNLSCSSHNLQLIVNTALLGNKNFGKLLRICRHIVGHFKHSALAQGKLFEIQCNLKLPTHSHLQDCATRCNSTYLMLNRLLEQKEALIIYVSCHDDKIPFLQASQWGTISKMVPLLKIFFDATQAVSGNLCQYFNKYSTG